MKKLIVLFLMFTAGIVYTAGISFPIYTAKAFVRAGQTDTANSIQCKGYSEVEICTFISGTDSVKLIVAIEGYFNGGYTGILKRDTFYLNESNAVLSKGFILRGSGVNFIPAIETLRVINTMSNIGLNDSLSALYYTQKIILRN